jgi:hypothetical protein
MALKRSPQTYSCLFAWLSPALTVVLCGMILDTPSPDPSDSQIETAFSLSQGNKPLTRAIASELNSGPAASTTLSKKELIAKLQAMLQRQVDKVTVLDESIQKRLQDTTTINLHPTDLKSDGQKLDALARQLDVLNAKRSENSARREVLDRLISAVDAKYSMQPLAVFLEQQLLDLSVADLSDPRGGRLWKTMTFLSVAIREIPEPHEDVLNVVEGYLNFTSVENPKNPAEYLATRSYTSGSESVMAHVTPRDHAGDTISQADDKDKAFNKNKDAPIMELRLNPNIDDLKQQSKTNQ